MPSVTLCIVNHASTEFLMECLRSLSEHPPLAEVHVEVVENLSVESIEPVRKMFPHVSVRVNTKPLGFSQNCNQVLKNVKTDYVFLLNPDTRLTAGAVDILVRFMEENTNTACCGPKILNFDGTLQYSARCFPDIFMAFYRGMPAGFLLPKNKHVSDYLMLDWDHNSLRAVDWVSGAAMMLRRDALENTGLLDEAFFMYVEDVDWCFRARKKGYDVYYVPEAVVYHYKSASAQKQAVRMIVEHHRSMYIYYMKHHKVGGRLRVPILMGLTVRCVLAVIGNRLNVLKSRLM